MFYRYSTLYLFLSFTKKKTLLKISSRNLPFKPSHESVHKSSHESVLLSCHRSSLLLKTPPISPPSTQQHHRRSTSSSFVRFQKTFEPSNLHLQKTFEPPSKSVHRQLQLPPAASSIVITVNSQLHFKGLLIEVQ